MKNTKSVVLVGQEHQLLRTFEFNDYPIRSFPCFEQGEDPDEPTQEIEVNIDDVHTLWDVLECDPTTDCWVLVNLDEDNAVTSFTTTADALDSEYYMSDVRSLIKEWRQS